MRNITCCILTLACVFPCFGATKPEGNVISAQGTVEYQAATVSSWAAVTPMQNLFVQDRVHTAAASKAAVLFRDETQIRLNANSELLVHSLSEKKGTSTALELVQGEGWFRTKNPSSDLHVATPGATAAIRGTEIDLRVAADGESVLTVVEGQVVFSNTWGSITVNAGEEASARQGEPPTKRLLLNPEDAVQWVIYYPTSVSWHDVLANPLSDATRAGLTAVQAGRNDEALAALLPLSPADVWARIGASLAYSAAGDYANARAILGEPVTGPVEMERLSQLATVALEVGDIHGALKALGAAQGIDPTGVRPASLAVTIALAQNQTSKAQEISAEALKAHPDSVAANVAAGETAQAAFDLPAALQYFNAALKIDPGDTRALVDRARVLFGMGRTAEASVDAGTASRLAPKDPQVRSLQGFILLSLGKLTDASAAFTAASTADPSFGEPHLGMGLLLFKRGKTTDGLWEMLIATLLDPKISLYQSYLGKAYFQMGRLTEGIAALDSAERLDPKDPTPHLYKSHFLSDLNRHVEALNEMNTAIALNDSRAVYRSRLLLDEDLATKNVSLAQAYEKVGMDNWGVSEALTSLASDFTNSSAHLFLAGLYSELPDRTQAMQSEFLQYVIFAPVNQNSFSSFDEYTSLLEQPMFSLSAYAEGATPSYAAAPPPAFYASGEVVTRSGNDVFTHHALVQYKYQVGARPGVPDQYGFGYLQAKVALGLVADLFLQVSYNLGAYGAEESEIQIYGSGNNEVSINQISTTLDPNIQSSENDLTVTFGGRVNWARGFPLVLIFQYQNNADETRNTAEQSAVAGYLLDSDFLLGTSNLDFQVQQFFHIGDRDQLMVGGEVFQGQRQVDNPVTVYDQTTGAKIGSFTSSNSSGEIGLHAWVWNEIQLGNFIHVSGALFAQGDTGSNLISDVQYSYAQFYPAVGVAFDIGRGTVLRAAFFQYRSTRLFPQSIFPCSIAGFVLERNEDTYTLRTEAHVSLDTTRGPLFVSNHLFFRYSEYPPQALILLSQAATVGLTSDFDWILAKFLTSSVNNQLELTTTSPFTETSDQLKTALTFTFPLGLTATLTNTVLGQYYIVSNISELANSLIDLLDAQLRYDFPGKRGYVSVLATNILDQSFTLFMEGWAVASLYPHRRLTLGLDLEL